MEWRPIPGYPGYEASDAGLIRSVDRLVVTPKGWARHRGCLLSQSPDDTGYLRAALFTDRRRNVRVHVLVAAAFLGPRPDGLYVCHNDGDKRNCRTSNLRYDTPGGNEADKRQHGSQYNLNKTHCPYGHLLGGNNVHPSAARRGWRGCRACTVAASYIRIHPNLDLRAEADRYYIRYTTEGAI